MRAFKCSTRTCKCSMHANASIRVSILIDWTLFNRFERESWGTWWGTLLIKTNTRIKRDNSIWNVEWKCGILIGSQNAASIDGSIERIPLGFGLHASLLESATFSFGWSNMPWFAPNSRFSLIYSRSAQMCLVCSLLFSSFPICPGMPYSCEVQD